MQTFKNGPISDWKKYKAGSVLAFRSKAARTVKFQVVSNAPVEIWASTDNKMSDGVLVGATRGKASIEYTAHGESFVLIKTDNKAETFVNLPDLDQRVASEGLPSFTKIAPRQRRNKEVDQMMQLMKYNELRREEQVKEERAALQSEMAALRSEMATQAPQEAPEEAEVVTEDAPTETAS